MKKSVIALLATLLAGSLTGCQTREAAVRTPGPETAMQQSWQGVIPCADCEGIQVTLTLQQGGHYRLKERYLGSESLEVTHHGRWTRTAEKLLLISERGEKRYFRAQENGLEMMDTQGNPIHSSHNYRLNPVNAAH